MDFWRQIASSAGLVFFIDVQSSRAFVHNIYGDTQPCFPA